MSSRNRGRQSVRSRLGRGLSTYNRSRSWEDPMGYDDSNRQAKFKNFCRSLATFMCTQVGVGGIIVGYAIVGAVVFRELETQGEPRANGQVKKVLELRNKTATALWHQFYENQLNQTEWNIVANSTLSEFQRNVVDYVKEGYNGKNATEQWNFPASLMFTLSIFTMIGYGNLVPRTDWGKAVTIIYALFGIPLYVLYFMNMGRAFANAFKWAYIKLNSCSVGSFRDSGEDDDQNSQDADYENNAGGGKGSSSRPSGRVVADDDDDDDDQPVVVPSTASLYVLLGYICVGTLMFSIWEDWNYLDAVYFCVTSLCKIGLGDFVPGTRLEDSLESIQTRLMINFIYLLLGLGLVAMCYNLLREEVLAKLKRLKSDVRDLCDFLKTDCSCNTCKSVQVVKNEARTRKRKRKNCVDGDMDVDVQENGERGSGRIREANNEVSQHEQNGAAADHLERELDGNNSPLPEGSSGEVTRPTIFPSVRGHDSRSNDIVYLPPLVIEDSKTNGEEAHNIAGRGPEEPDYDPFADEEEIASPTNSNKVLVYFGGDIQDTEDVMRTSGDYKNYINWNLENVAQILQRQFPTFHIVVVRPVRMQIYMLSCFDNFVPMNSNTGHPEHTPNNYALQHLELLLKTLSNLIQQNAKSKARKTNSNNGNKSAEEEDSVVSSTTTEEGTGTNGVDASHEENLNPHLERANISLVGFSKGCVVLNQLIYEFHYLKTLTPDDRSMEGFLKSIKNMYWLDGGHGGGKNTWITSRSLLETLTRTGIRLHVHMTPYQLNDSRRPYIRREEKAFTEVLNRLGALICRHVHFTKEHPSLEIHFQLIAQFGLIAPEFTDKSDEESNELPAISILPMSSDFDS